MAMGPEEARLRTWLAGADKARIARARDEWSTGADTLRAVATALERAAPRIHTQFKETGPAAARAFATVADKVRERSQQMLDASTALDAAHAAVDRSEKLRDHFDAHPLAEPGPAPKPSPGPSRPEDVDALRAYHTQQATYDSAVAQREQQAEAANTHMTTVYASSTETMKKVHGEPDAVPPTTTSGGGGGGGGTTAPTTTTHAPGGSRGIPTTGGGSLHTITITDGHPTSPPPTGPTHQGATPGAPDGPTTGGHHLPPGSSQSGSPTVPAAAVPSGSTGPGALSGGPGTGGSGGLGGATVGGLAGAVGGGAIGGMAGIGGAVRGPLGVPTSGAGSTSGTGGRSIGSTSRASGAARGALGRGGMVEEEGAAGGRGGSSGARSAGGGTRGAGGRAGSRGQAGGRGSAGGGQGGRTRKDPRKKSTDLFEEEQDWIDDEGAAPGVID